MGFLSPALWLGALALAFPIWLHLRKRRVEAVIRLPTLRFLQDEPVPSTGPSRLRNPLLLLVRALALLAIVAAFTRPWIADDATSRVVESRVHVLDNTLSQQVEDRFQRDRESVARALASADGRVEQAVVEVAAIPRVVVRFGDDPATGAQRVRAIEPSSERGSYLAAARLASSLLERGLGQRRVIVFHGDGQKNQWSEGESALPFLAGVEVTVADPPTVATRPNLAVLFPEVRRGWERETPTVELVFQVHHSGGGVADVEVQSGRGVVLSKALALPAEPGPLAIRAVWPADPTMWVGGVVSVAGEPDALAGDNRAWFAVPPLAEGRVALLGRSRYLATALEPAVMKGRWSVRKLGLDRVDDPDPDDDVFVVEASYLPSPPVRERVARMLAAGRGVVVVVDHASPLVAEALRGLGAELASTAEVGPLEGDESAFRYVATHHPVFRPFLAGGLGEVGDARVFRYFSLRPDGLQSLLYSASGDPLVAEVPGKRGRLLLISFPLERDHTDWPLQTSFVPFLDQVLGYVRKRDADHGASRPGEWRALVMPRDRRPERLVITGRDGFRQEVEVGGDELARFRAPTRPGLYEIRFDAAPRLERILAVNPAPEESALEYDAEPRAIALWTSGPAPQAQEAEAPPGLPPGADEQIWWHALLVAALALIVLELVMLSLHRERHAAA